MKLSGIVNFLLLIIGGFIALYAESGTNQNQYLLVAGIFILMIGVYRISRNIPNKIDKESIKNNDDEF